MTKKLGAEFLGTGWLVFGNPGAVQPFRYPRVYQAKLAERNER